MKKILIQSSATVYSALQKLQDSMGTCLIVIDKKKKLLGTLTDGDIRRAILKKKKLSQNVGDIYKKKCLFVYKKSKNMEKLIDLCTKRKVKVVPIVNKEKKVVDYFSFKDSNVLNLKKENTNLEVVIMAGGEGSRLKPLTNTIPKPLIPLHDKTVIEKIIDKFTEQGFKNFYLSINYKKGVIKKFFKNLKPKFNLKYIEEKKKLGTAGSLFFLRSKKKKSYFIINCDSVIDINCARLIDFHKKNKYDLTLVASAKKFIVPYGSCEIKKNGELSRLVEKPEHFHLVNTGLYMINNQLFNYIKKNTYLDFDQFIEKIINKNKKIGIYPISENSWSDVGKWDEYKKFLEKL